MNNKFEHRCALFAIEDNGKSVTAQVSFNRMPSDYEIQNNAPLDSTGRIKASHYLKCFGKAAEKMRDLNKNESNYKGVIVLTDYSFDPFMYFSKKTNQWEYRQGGVQLHLNDFEMYDANNNATKTQTTTQPTTQPKRDEPEY